MKKKFLIVIGIVFIGIYALLKDVPPSVKDVNVVKHIFLVIGGLFFIGGLFTKKETKESDQ